MKYFSVTELKKKGFKKIGKNVQVSKNVNFLLIIAYGAFGQTRTGTP